jgi:hypothetical protein
MTGGLIFTAQRHGQGMQTGRRDFQNRWVEARADAYKKFPERRKNFATISHKFAQQKFYDILRRYTQKTSEPYSNAFAFSVP